MMVLYKEWKSSRTVIKSIWKHRIQNCKPSWGAWTFSVSNPKIIEISGQKSDIMNMIF